MLRADVVMLNPSKDNTLYEVEDGGLSAGSGPHLFAGPILTGTERRAVVAFDVAGNIPEGSTITLVTLSLECTMSLSGGGNGALYRLTSDWGEGASNTGEISPGGMGAPSEPGDATWIHTFFPETFWSNPGGDHVVDSSAETVVGGAGTYVWGPTDAMVDDVTDWLNDPAENYGWVLIGHGISGEAKRYASRENITVPHRPLLLVEYEPPAKSSFGDCDGDGDVDLADFGSFQLCFSGAGGGPVDEACDCSDSDGDGDVDLVDFAEFQLVFTGPL
jgi:hypothetical protein